MRFSIAFVLLLSLLLSACKDSPSSFGDEFIPGNDRYSFSQADTSAVKDSTYFNESYPEVKSHTEAIVLGKYGNYHSTMMLRFPFTAPDSIKSMLTDGTITITKAWVSLVGRYYMGDSASPFNFTVHRITSNTDLNKVTASTFQSITYDAADIASNKNIVDTLTTFTLDPNVVRDWIRVQTADSTSVPKNYGILLQPTPETNKAYGYLGYSTTQGIAPEIYLVFQKGTQYTDTLSSFATRNTYYATAPFPTGTDQYITLQGTINYQNKLIFKLPKLPTNAVMNKATLDLYIDSTKSDIAKPSKSTYSELATVVDAEMIKTANTLDIDTTQVKYITRLSSPNRFRYSGDVTTFVQKWINTGENYGMIIAVDGQEYDGSKLVFYGSSYPDASKRPRLRITYSTRNN